LELRGVNEFDRLILKYNDKTQQWEDITN